MLPDLATIAAIVVLGAAVATAVVVAERWWQVESLRREAERVRASYGLPTPCMTCGRLATPCLLDETTPDATISYVCPLGHEWEVYL